MIKKKKLIQKNTPKNYYEGVSGRKKMLVRKSHITSFTIIDLCTGTIKVTVHKRSMICKIGK